MVTRSRIGGELDTVVLAQDMRLLNSLPCFSHARYEVTCGLDADSCAIEYHVQENLTTIPNFNVYTTIDKRLAFRVGLYEFNLLGKNMTLGGLLPVGHL